MTKGFSIAWALVLLAASFALPARALTLREPQPDKPHAVFDAAVAEGRLWALANDGVLMSMPLDGGAARIDDPGQPVYRLCRDGDDVSVLTAVRDHPVTFTLRRYQDGRWRDQGHFDLAAGDGLMDMACASGRAVIVTQTQLIDMRGGNVTVHPLTGDPLRHRVATSLLTSRFVYLAIEGGEWGGGLRRVDLATGAMISIENKTGELCGGFLNAACHPVTGLALSPWQPDCVLATIGLEHMGLREGRVVQVCGETVTRVYADPLPDSTEKWPKTVSFYDLAGDGPDVMAQSPDHLYRVHRDGTADKMPFPALTSNGLFAYSFAVPGVALAGTLGGTYPVMAPKD